MDHMTRKPVFRRLIRTLASKRDGSDHLYVPYLELRPFGAYRGRTAVLRRRTVD